MWRFSDRLAFRRAFSLLTSSAVFLRPLLVSTLHDAYAQEEEEEEERSKRVASSGIDTRVSEMTHCNE